MFSRRELLEHVWGSTQEWQDPATVTEHVRRLRLKLEPDPARPAMAPHRSWHRLPVLRGSDPAYVGLPVQGKPGAAMSGQAITT